MLREKLDLPIPSIPGMAEAIRSMFIIWALAARAPMGPPIFFGCL